MGRKSNNGGVTAYRDRIQYQFMLDGVRYRPTLDRIPTEANLTRAREHLRQIKERIRAGTFRFAEEFPDYRRLHKVVDDSQLRTCDRVFDEYLAHCEARVERGEMAAATLRGYRRSLDTTWRPQIGPLLFLKVPFSTLTKVADANKVWGKKTYNNNIVVLRRAFAFGHRNHPEAFNPAWALKCARLGPRDRPKPDPFRIFEAEALVAGIHQDWGEAQGNYDEFRFFTGLRPSEQIALLVPDYDATLGTLTVSKACVFGIDKDCTKTRQDRVIQLCPRAIDVLRRQLELRERLGRAGLINHNSLFFLENGEPIRSLNVPGQRWRQTLKRLRIRYRKPYAARHTSVSWNLMVGKSPLLNAKQHGHSVATMWRVYSAWMDGALETDIEAIRSAMQCAKPACPSRLGVRCRGHAIGSVVQRALTAASAVRHWCAARLAAFGTGFGTRGRSGFATTSSAESAEC
ncbi:MAG TPA: DUF3596 domain-containing protein [Steroidobacteraceae bacterium]|jgi:integrase